MKASRVLRTVAVWLAAPLMVILATSGQPARADAAEPEEPPAAEDLAAEDPAGEALDAAIYMPDGQLRSHTVRVYVTRDLTDDEQPRLQLLRSDSLLSTKEEKAAANATKLAPIVIASGQQWIQTVEAQKVGRSGTVLLYDLSGLELKLKPMLRVMPLVSWTEDGATRVAVGAEEVSIVSIRNTVLWTAIVTAVAFLLVLWLSKRAAGNPLLLLTGAHGRLSLAQTQIALWTVAIGGVVLGYGLVRLVIPEIPESLLVLMGASLGTGGLGFFQDAKKVKAAANSATRSAAPTLALGDLVRVVTSDKPQELSLAKAQMLFWTVLLLVLFVSKSVLDGAIWQVPWALVALMGFSQAGYLVPKLAEEQEAQPPAAPPPGAGDGE